MCDTRGIGKRPVLRADVQGPDSVKLAGPPMHFLILLNEAFAFEGIHALVVGGDEFASLPRESPSPPKFVVSFEGGYERAARFVG